MTRRLPSLVFGVSLVVLVFGAAGGPGWGSSSDHAVLAAQLERTAAAPLYGILAGVAAYLPVGEVGFRLALLGAVLGALTLAGVVAAAIALVRKDALAGVIGALLLALTPPFRDAAGFATPSILTACGTVWAIAFAIEHARVPSGRQAAFAIAAVAVVVGSAPWLGAALAVVITGSLARTASSRKTIAYMLGAVGALATAWWIGAVGRMPELAPSLTAMVAASGAGAAAIVVAAGLLGAAFATATVLPNAYVLGLTILTTAAHAICVDPEPAPLLGLLAIGCSVIPSALVQVVGSRKWRRLVAIVAGLPLVAGAWFTGPATGVDDPGAAPARIATDVIGGLPPGPGVIVMTRDPLWSAVLYAQAVTGARPDLELVAPAPAIVADGIVADALRAQRIVGSDVVAFGRLDPTRAVPRGRGFELRGTPSSLTLPPLVPAAYASEIGAQQSVLLALSRARYEANAGRLDAAAHAAGLAERFGAGNLAVLAITGPVPPRPALFDFIPRLDDRAAGTWLLELFGDDLAWVAGIDDDAVVVAPYARLLHSLWRKVLVGTLPSDDPVIIAMGPEAIRATETMLAALRKKTAGNLGEGYRRDPHGGVRGSVTTSGAGGTPVGRRAKRLGGDAVLVCMRNTKPLRNGDPMT